MKQKTLITCMSAALLMLSGVANAEIKDVELRVGDSLPPDHIISKNLTQPWIERVKELSDGKITVKYYPAEQAGKAKDMLSLTQAGVLDIGYVGPAYVSDKMPLSGVAELPGMFNNSCQVTKAYWSMAQEGEYFYENEYKPNKIRPLFIAALPPYQMVIGNDKNIEKLADFNGLKVRAAGGAQELTLRKLDVVPIKMAPPEIYESMSRGTIDGALLPFISIDSYKLSPLAKTATHDANFGTVIVTYSISDKKWNSLPAEVQEILRKAGDEVTNNACAAFDKAEKSTMEELKNAGVKLVDFTEEELAVIDAAKEEVANNWAEKLDKRNRPGSETLKAFSERLAATN